MKKLNLTPEEMRVRRMAQIKKSNIKNKEKQKAHKLKKKAENPEKFKQQRHESYLRTKEHVLQKAKIDYIKNRERALAYAKARHLEPGFKESKAAYCKKWQRENREYQNQKIKEKYHSDIDMKIKANLGNRIRAVLKMINEPKTKFTTELVGCTIKQLRCHLASLFTEGMNWKNHTLHGWHIDHIMPCSLFDLSDPIQQKKCFHWSNLQPLWGPDNIRKSDKHPDVWREEQSKVKKYILNPDLVYQEI